MAAGNNFFADPPQIVVPGAGNNYATAMSLTNGTAANTVIWYTGENGATPARQTQTALVGPSTTVDYGMRANEQAITNIGQECRGARGDDLFGKRSQCESELSDAVVRRWKPISVRRRARKSSPISKSDIANAQTTVTNATKLNTQTQKTLSDILQNIDGVNQTQVGEQILTLAEQLSASMSVTARLAQISLVNYLAPSAG